MFTRADVDEVLRETMKSRHVGQTLADFIIKQGVPEPDANVVLMAANYLKHLKFDSTRQRLGCRTLSDVLMRHADNPYG